MIPPTRPNTRRRAAGIRLVIRALTALIIVGSLPLPIAPNAAAAETMAPANRRPTPLEQALLRAVVEARFDQVIDFGPANEDRDIPAGSARPIAHPPNVDVAVIQLDEAGRAVAFANVLLSRDYPRGLIVPVDRQAGATSVRFLRWDIDRWNGGTFRPGTNGPLQLKGWTNQPPLTADDDLVPGRSGAAHQFMAPYPASLFKLLVAFHVLRLTDQASGPSAYEATKTGTAAAAEVLNAERSGARLSLDAPVTFAPTNAPSETRPLRAWLDAMITVSDNRATQALLQMLHRRGEIEAMNRGFRDLGLGTLQINGTRASDGRGWQTDRIHMTAFDTARLLWLIEGPDGDLWRGPDGRPITAQALSPASRAFLRKLLLEQGLNEALSTANLAGLPNVRPGLPSLIAPRWIDPGTGLVHVDGISFGADVRPSQALAEVAYAHKSGLTYNYASDAGIVTSLPGKPFRRYVIAFLSNLGYRYTDEVFARRTRGPYADKVGPISYTQRIPAMARAIDQALIRLSAQP